MVEHEKALVSFDRFVELLNEELKHSPSYRDGMRFINMGTGYDFIAPMLSITENQLDKWVFDRVRGKYSIAL
ncbi:hypothetical protein ACFQAT_28955 [Undibacterium arcticum]|uniref:hypothetical protein n=1 Tax=Undibacterium arcticum TaxID=1762892 RepID=UPI00361D3044